MIEQTPRQLQSIIFGPLNDLKSILWELTLIQKMQSLAVSHGVHDAMTTLLPVMKSFVDHALTLSSRSPESLTQYQRLIWVMESEEGMINIQLIDVFHCR